MFKRVRNSVSIVQCHLSSELNDCEGISINVMSTSTMRSGVSGDLLAN